jgi:hypothetical protein
VSDSVVLVVKGDGARAAVEGFEASTPHSFQITTLAVSLFRLLRMKCEELSAKKDWQMRSGSRYTPPPPIPPVEILVDSVLKDSSTNYSIGTDNPPFLDTHPTTGNDGCSSERAIRRL